MSWDLSEDKYSDLCCHMALLGHNELTQFELHYFEEKHIFFILNNSVDIIWSRWFKFIINPDKILSDT